jgi:hypothetical protein
MLSPSLRWERTLKHRVTHEIVGAKSSSKRPDAAMLSVPLRPAGIRSNYNTPASKTPTSPRLPLLHHLALTAPFVPWEKSGPL